MADALQTRLDARAGAALHPGVRRREVLAWAMYDFANSGYTTVVLTAVFNAYFVGVVAQDRPWATLAWTAALSVSYLLILLSAPALGAYADARAARKKLLAITTLGCVLCTAGLAAVGPGEVALAAALVIASNFFFGSGENLAAAFLPELARPRALGRVSGLGWSLGYLGGLLSLGASLAFITWAEARGWAAADYVPGSMLITAGMFAAASLPAFWFVRERGAARTTGGRGGARAAWARVARTAREARRFTDLSRFLIATVLYQAGVQAVITLAAVYAQQAMGFDTTQTLLLVLAVNITAAVGALAFGFVQDRLGHIPTLSLTLVLWLLTVLLAWLATAPPLFWVAANLAGLAMGASQSGGRALVGLLSPAAQRGEFFGLWGLAVKLSAVFGPLTYGLANWLSGGDHRLAMLTTAGYFVIGLVLLRTVNVRRGRAAALRAGRQPLGTEPGPAAGG